MIPKVIHYCWFGRNPLPQEAIECIESWKSYFPDYEIKQWNEDNFDVNICSYTQEAYNAKKYAFVSDYARFWILYNFGGVYFDTDVKALAPMGDILSDGPFMGCEVDGVEDKLTYARVAPGLGMAAEPNMKLIYTLLQKYNEYHFISPLDGSYNLKTIVEYTTELLQTYGFPKQIKGILRCGGFNIFPKEYFAPRSVDGRSTIITSNTRTIHLYANSWGDKSFFYHIKSETSEFVRRFLLPTFVVKYVLRKKKHQRDGYFKTYFIIKK
jgi:hypothetical protein